MALFNRGGGLVYQRDMSPAQLAWWTLYDAVRGLGQHARFQPALDAALALGGVDLDWPDEDGSTLLHCAACHRVPEAARAMITALVAAGADVHARDVNGANALHCAALNEVADSATAAIEALVAAGKVDVHADTGRTQTRRQAIHFAARNPNADGCWAAIKALVAAGADPRARDAERYEPLHYGVALSPNAAAATAMVESLVAAGASVHAKDISERVPLHMACTNNDARAAAAAIVALVAAGGDVGAPADDGRQPLHTAARHVAPGPAVATIKALVAAGADVNAHDRNQGIQLMHLAARNECFPVAMAAVRALAAAGGDVNGKTLDGRRPLHVAAHQETALLLVRLGASLTLKINSGISTLQTASGGSAVGMAALRKAAASERNCFGCGAGGENLKRCTRCRTASYCSPACQKAHWPTHKHTCQQVV